MRKILSIHEDVRNQAVRKTFWAMEKKRPDAEAILVAARRIESFVIRTPVLTSAALDKSVGGSLFFKCENLQPIGAFKVRGAANAILSCTADQLRYGVATHSSGNHAQAVARAAKLAGVPAYIVMPTNTPKVKRNGVLFYEGKIVDCEPTLQSREETLEKVVHDTGAHVVHPYNDYDVIAGQATAAKELFDDVENLDYVLTPVGGEWHTFMREVFFATHESLWCRTFRRR